MPRAAGAPALAAFVSAERGRRGSPPRARRTAAPARRRPIRPGQARLLSVQWPCRRTSREGARHHRQNIDYSAPRDQSLRSVGPSGCAAKMDRRVDRHRPLHAPAISGLFAQVSVGPSTSPSRRAEHAASEKSIAGDHEQAGNMPSIDRYAPVAAFLAAESPCSRAAGDGTARTAHSGPPRCKDAIRLHHTFRRIRD